MSQIKQFQPDTQWVILCQIWVVTFLKGWNYEEWDKTGPYLIKSSISDTYSVITEPVASWWWVWGQLRNVDLFSEVLCILKAGCYFCWEWNKIARALYVQNSQGCFVGLWSQGKGLSLSFLQLAFTVSLAELMHHILEAQVSSEPRSGCWQDLTDCTYPFQARCCRHNSLRNSISGKLSSTN